MNVEDAFLIMSMVILIGFAGRLIREKTKIPEALFLIVFGLILGPISGIVPGKEMLELVPFVSTAAMVSILIESGIEFKISKLTGALGTATVFTLLVAVITTVIVTCFLVIFFSWPIAHAALLGLISSGTTTLTAMTLLNSVKVTNKIKNIILRETIINDFTLIIGTFIIVGFIKVNNFGISDAANLFFSELTIGLLIGIIFAIVWRQIMLRLNKKKELTYASTLGTCFMMYYVVSFLGGNAIISIFAFSLILGNYDRISNFINSQMKRRKEEDFSQYLSRINSVKTDFGFFISSSFFVLLGIIFDPAIMNLELFMIAGGVLLIIIAARGASATMISADDKDLAKHKLLISLMIPRGYVAAVLAFVPLQQGIDIPGIANIMILLIISTTLVAIAGTAAYAKMNG